MAQTRAQQGQSVALLGPSSNRNLRPWYQGGIGVCRCRCEPEVRGQLRWGRGSYAFCPINTTQPDKYSLECVLHDTMALRGAGHASGPPQALT